MIKISNLLQAGALMLGLVFGLYGNVDVQNTGNRPVRGARSPRLAARLKARLQAPAAPTVLQEVSVEKTKPKPIDLTRDGSRTRTVSAPFKSDGGGPT